MEQLLSMGFTQELASQALAATGGKSALEATEWLLRSSPPEAAAASSSRCPSSKLHKEQARVDHFFASSYRTTNHCQATHGVTLTDPSEAVGSSVVDLKTGPCVEEFSKVCHSHSAAHLNPSNDVLGACVLSDTPSPVAETPPKRRRMEDDAHLLRQAPAALKPTSLPPALANRKIPLAERMRPSSIDEILGQDHLLGPGCILRSLLESNTMASVIFWGPPGTGKTSLARAIARSVSCRFVTASAVTSGIKEVREILEEAKHQKRMGQRTLFFVDEVHRFNKAQQDAFLPSIEAGHIIFIGATTENPSFEVNAALLSRCKVLTLNKLQPGSIKKLLHRALTNVDRGVMVAFVDDPLVQKLEAEDEALDFLAQAADGDARVALNALEVAVSSAVSRGKQQSKVAQDDKAILLEGCLYVRLVDVSEALQRSHLLYDKNGEEHYNIISALHKSMRGGDPDAALYWLARMLEGGEGPLYIARRLVRFAGEDVGLADPQALTQAVACYQACHFLGMPECNVHLAQCAVYLSLAPKSVAIYQAIEAAQQLVKTKGNDPVPLHLRNAPTGLMKQLGYGKGYIYPPGCEGPVEQEYLPPPLRSYKFLKWP